MNEINDFIEISKYAGERFDLVQAAGGNSSVKIKDNEEMLIKASGFLLSDIKKNIGYSTVLTKSIADIVNNEEIVTSRNKRERELLASSLLKKSTLDTFNRPSIETLLHSLLLKYTLHTHPIVVNMIVSRKNSKDLLTDIFKDEEIAFVHYETPGIDLAIALNKELKKFKKIPKIIFLQNHGLIVTSNNKDDIITVTDSSIKKIEDYLKINFDKYKLTNSVSFLFDSFETNFNLTYLSEDNYLNEQLNTNKNLFYEPPFCPDTLVYCGLNPLKINNLIDYSCIKNYVNNKFLLPKVIIFGDYLLIRAPSIKKAKEIEEVLKFHIMILEQNKNIDLNFLDKEELNYLSNWEAEKYRQKL